MKSKSKSMLAGRREAWRDGEKAWEGSSLLAVGERDFTFWRCAFLLLMALDVADARAQACSCSSSPPR